MPRPTVLAAAGAALLAALAGCSGSSSTAGVRSPSPTPTPTPSAGQQLATLARAGLQSSYTATYHLHSSAGAATVRVYRTPTALRIDVVAGATTAVFLRNVHGTYSCALQGSTRTCTAPAALSPGVQLVFSRYLDDWAGHPRLYDVTREPAQDGASCFHVVPAAAAAQAASGTYCLQPTGILQSVTFASGTLTLTSVGPAPTSAQLHPPARPVPVPSASG